MSEIENQPKAVIKYAGDEMFVGISPSGHAQIIDSNHERNAAATPIEMLMMSLGACTAVDVISILHKKRQNVTDYRVEVTGTRRDEHPRSFTSFQVNHIVCGHSISSESVESAVKLSDEKYCSVAATLKPSVEITTSFEIIEVENEDKKGK